MSSLAAHMTKDPANQFEWHESYRDQVKNMYRTSYMDSSHFREISVKSDFPAGYGGHIAAIRHDVLHRNTEFDRKMALMRSDPNRDALPSFNDQISGIPTITKLPCGAPRNPTYKVSLHDGTTAPMAPWGITVNMKREPLSMRFMPPTMKRALSTSAMHQRPNEAAASAGSILSKSPSSPNMMVAQQQQQLRMMQAGVPSPSRGAEGLRYTVDVANERAMEGHMPTEAEILYEQMHR